MASGFGMAFTKAMLSSIFLTGVYSIKKKVSDFSSPARHGSKRRHLPQASRIYRDDREQGA